MLHQSPVTVAHNSTHSCRSETVLEYDFVVHARIWKSDCAESEHVVGALVLRATAGCMIQLVTHGSQHHGCRCDIVISILRRGSSRNFDCSTVAEHIDHCLVPVLPCSAKTNSLKAQAYRSLFATGSAQHFEQAKFIECGHAVLSRNCSVYI